MRVRRRLVPAMMAAVVLPISIVSTASSSWLKRNVNLILPGPELALPSSSESNSSDVSVVPSVDEPISDVVTWTVSVDREAGVVRGVLQSTVESVVPYFEDVRLVISRGSADVDCGSFSTPTLLDNGAWRYWVYTAPIPMTGSCANAQTGSLGARGIRGGTDRKASPKP